VAPDITQFNNTRRGADRVTRYANISQTEAGDTGTAGRWKVSAKIQQLLNTLKRPKRRPLPEFYEDNDIELEIAANPKDPNAPRPEGSTMTAIQGEQLAVPSALPRTLEQALQRFGVNNFKSPMATVLDPNGKMTTTLTYGKLLSRASKIAYALTTKVFCKGPEQITLKPGDRVALVYPNSDPLSFITAWYGCMFRGLIPLPIELPLSTSDTPPQQVGFLLRDIAKLKGWPRLHWFVTEHLPKPPKDFNVGNVRVEESVPAYIEYTSDKDGSVMGTAVIGSNSNVNSDGVEGGGGSSNIPPYYNLKDPQMVQQMQQGGGIQLSSEGYSYVTEVPSLPSSHHRHHKSSSHHHSGSGSNQNRTRRTQRRITHNEKRYHSGRFKFGLLNFPK
uniref:AMP-dependent synthetase/ligase domain-containing protein n=1 Tax=Megaselia scalaris TaxID=36166 RepID=T1GIU0_MEGSC